VFSFFGVVFFLDNGIDVDFSLAVWSQEHVDHLLACPQFNWLDYRRRRDLNALICIREECSVLHKLGSIDENILLSDQVTRSQEVLRCCDQGLTCFGNAKILFGIHKASCLGFSFQGLRNVDVHLVTIKIGVVGSTDTLIESQGPVWHDSGFV
jgi:hypothetical protein